MNRSRVELLSTFDWSPSKKENRFSSLSSHPINGSRCVFAAAAAAADVMCRSSAVAELFVSAESRGLLNKQTNPHLFITLSLSFSSPSAWIQLSCCCFKAIPHTEVSSATSYLCWCWVTQQSFCWISTKSDYKRPKPALHSINGLTASPMVPSSPGSALAPHSPLRPLGPLLPGSPLSPWREHCPVRPQVWKNMPEFCGL